MKSDVIRKISLASIHSKKVNHPRQRSVPHISFGDLEKGSISYYDQVKSSTLPHGNSHPLQRFDHAMVISFQILKCVAYHNCYHLLYHNSNFLLYLCFLSKNNDLTTFCFLLLIVNFKAGITGQQWFNFYGRLKRWKFVKL